MSNGLRYRRLRAALLVTPLVVFGMACVQTPAPPPPAPGSKPPLAPGPRTQPTGLGVLRRVTEIPSGILLESEGGASAKLRDYGAGRVRVQVVRAGEAIHPDDHYEIVERHDFGKTGLVVATEDEARLVLTAMSPASATSSLRIVVDKAPLRLNWEVIGNDGSVMPILAEAMGPLWEGDQVGVNWIFDPQEHFFGVGHQAYGKVPSLDLAGRRVDANYGSGLDDWGPQAPLVVPFFLSTRGYGLFVNSMYDHHFDFGTPAEGSADARFEVRLDHRALGAQLDYFVIAGPSFATILDRYTELTGRPRLPQLSMFGLQLSDKADPKHEGAQYWQRRVQELRAAGYPLDHMIFDNRWRAGSGAWEGSWFEWSKQRFPDPRALKRWMAGAGLTVTLDFNRNIANDSAGWKPEYNMPGATCVDHSDAVPDYTSPETRQWLWRLFWEQAIDPSLESPVDGLWIDEPDSMNCVPDETVLANGRTWAEMENYYLFLNAKAVGQEGWDNADGGSPPGVGDAKRPFIWIRGGTAGGQRYASHWTGDIWNDYEWMKEQVRAMQASGLSGFPFFNHDAGGFRDQLTSPMYQQWAMALGSFTPIWRPHGFGPSRWPIDRSEADQRVALAYSRLRYEHLPYIYSLAWQAASTGMPMARPMVFEHPQEPEAWKRDLQYYWGEAFLVAPSFSDGGEEVEVWLPNASADWHRFGSDERAAAGVRRYQPELGELLVFVPPGALVPSAPYAKSSFFIDPKRRTVDVYGGADGHFELYEDDGVTEAYRGGAHRITPLHYDHESGTLTIGPAKGAYDSANESRSWTIRTHGLGKVRAQFEGRQLDRTDGGLFALPERAVGERLAVTLQE